MKSKTGAALAALLLASACGQDSAGNASANGAAPAVAANAAAPAQPAAAPTDLGGARSMVETAYAPYTRDETADYFRHFTPELNAAIERAGEGAIEADPLCDCQDFSRFTYRIQSLEPAPDGAKAVVAITNGGESKLITLHLVRRGATWLIADVGEGATRLTQTLGR